MLAKDYIMLALSEEHLSNVEPVVKRLRGEAGGGIPWIAILDGNGELRMTSDGPNGNIGYPFEVHEIGHFIAMLQQTTRHITADEILQLKTELETYADKTRKARQAAQPRAENPGE